VPFLTYEVNDHLATITFRAPERLNAISAEGLEELRSATVQFREDDDARVLLIRGDGRAFCAGRDLKAHATSGQSPEVRYDDQTNIFCLAETSKPVITAIQGYAIGAGWYFVAGSDIRIAAEGTKFSMAEVPTGLLGPYWLSAAESLPWCLGFEYAIVGTTVDAGRMLELGLLNEVVPAEELDAAAGRWARKLLALPPEHIKETKLLMSSMRTTPDEDLLARELEARKRLDSLDDTLEAVNAFIEKRTPVYTGRKR